MALAKEGYTTALRGVATTLVPFNEDGFIALTSETIQESRNLQMTMVDADNSESQNTQAANIFLGFVPNTRVGSPNKMRVTWEVWEA